MLSNISLRHVWVMLHVYPRLSVPRLKKSKIAPSWKNVNYKKYIHIYIIVMQTLSTCNPKNSSMVRDLFTWPQLCFRLLQGQSNSITNRGTQSRKKIWKDFLTRSSILSCTLFFSVATSLNLRLLCDLPLYIAFVWQSSTWQLRYNLILWNRIYKQIMVFTDRPTH